VTAVLAARALVLGALAATLGACATAAPSLPPPPPVTPPRVETPPPPPPPIVSARARLAAPHDELSQQLERAGDLRRALDESRIALTIDPDDRTAQEAQKRLEAQIERGVTQRIEEGRAALTRGAYAEARRRFLAALALDPTNVGAQEALRKEAPEMDVVNHTVRPGETLASLAQQYYGDSARAEVIADANNVLPNARLTAGKTIKVPEVPGVPFTPPTRREMPALPPLALPAPSPSTSSTQAAPRGEAAVPPAPAPPAPAPAPPPPPPVNPLLAGAENAFERRQYTAALSDLDKLLAQNPGHSEGLALKKQVLYRMAKSQYDQKNYGEAYRSLTELTKLAPSYEDTSALIQDSRRRLVEQHYSRGLSYYREEKLPDAIAEWRRVLELDPQHVSAKANIEQAEKLLKGLEERKKKK
jgi:tetratricopeptide (TPR) repeat protein